MSPCILEWWADGEKNFEDMYTVTVYSQYRRVTDGQTDGRTDILPRHSPRYTYASRGKNGTSNNVQTFRRYYLREELAEQL